MMIALRYEEIAGSLSHKKRLIEQNTSLFRENLRLAIWRYCELKMGYADLQYDFKNIKKHLPVEIKNLINQLLF